MTGQTKVEAKPARFHIAGSEFSAPSLVPGLYVVATPIGNLRDITIRALETLAAADVVLCEDTRLSARLLDHYGITTRRIALHEHNEREKTETILERVTAGAAIALISDAGTPLLSDPGFPLVRAARAGNHPVFAVPGASALLSGLSVAGLPTDRFSFIGFLPQKAVARKTALDELATRPETLVFYESPRRLGASLSAMAEVFGPERTGAVALELTKRFERVFTGTLAELAVECAKDIKGEAVILVGGAEPQVLDPNLWQAELAEALGDQPLRMAVDEVAKRFGLKRRDVYEKALELKNSR